MTLSREERKAMLLSILPNLPEASMTPYFEMSTDRFRTTLNALSKANFERTGRGALLAEAQRRHGVTGTDESAAFALRREVRKRELMAACPDIAPANMALYMDMTDPQFEIELRKLRAFALKAAPKSVLLDEARRRHGQ